jgi:hypothetical protein
MLLDREEYIEQAYFFRILGERLEENATTQELLATAKEELLATSKLVLAIDFLAAELRHQGVFATAMARLAHYFTPFQTYVIAEAERERGRFDFAVALKILEREAKYRAAGATPQGIFLYQFECLCRNRLSYDHGLNAIAADPIFDEAWREWIYTVRRQVGLVPFSDLLFVRSEHYRKSRSRLQLAESEVGKPILFGEREGKIAKANRNKDPLYMFAALERHLGYPSVPRPERRELWSELIPTLMRRLERLESRIKLLEEEQKGGIDISKFFGPQRKPDWENEPE